MNRFILAVGLLGLVLNVAECLFLGSGITGVATVGNSLAFTTGTGTVFASGAGVALGAAGLIGAAVVKGILLSRLARGRGGRRGKRDLTEAEAHAEILAELDAYFQAVAKLDVDDCGKRYVCEIETLSAEQRTEEEELVASLFGEDTTLDPASNKAEFDLAAFLGQTVGDKVVCARRYNKCPVDRKTISQALQKNN